MSKKRERGYWWVARPDGEEIVYWTGAEVQLFGTDATLREHEIASWIRFEGTTIKRPGSDWSEHAAAMASTKGHVVEAARAVERLHARAVANDPRITLPPGCAFNDEEDGVSVVVYVAHGMSTMEARKAMWSWLDKQAGVVRQGAVPPLDESELPPGYSLHDDHEDPVFQAVLNPWGGTWTTDPLTPPKEAWAHLRGLSKPLLDQARAETETMHRRAERAGQYLTEVVTEHNAAVEAASQKAYARVAAIVWPPDEREGKTPEDVLARVQALAGEPLTRLDLKTSRDLIEAAVARARGYGPGSLADSIVDDAISCIVRAAQAAPNKGMPVDLAEQAAWLRGQREAHDDVRDIIAREDSLDGLRSALEDLVDGEIGEGKEPVKYPGPTTRTVRAIVTSLSERVIPPVTFDEQDIVDMPPHAMPGLPTRYDHGIAPEVVDQRLDNDCMRCCLAMMLGLPYEAVPHFVAQHPPDRWPAEMARWLDARGWSVVDVHATGDGELLPSIFGAPTGPWIASGPAERGRIHAVLYQGAEMLHDPHPSRAGLEAITGATVLWPKPKPRGDQ